jgi:hypothetical protein
VTSADAVHRKRGALARGWRDFRRWRRRRPFWAGFFTLLGGLIIYGSTQLSFSNFQIKIGNEGFLSYVIPLVLLLCALLIWFTPQQRIFYGVIAVAVALYSFIGVNFGGFFFGMLFGIIGGSLAIAWAPVQPVPPAGEPAQPGGDPAEGEAGPAEDDTVAVRDEAVPAEHPQPEASVDELLTGPLTDTLPPPVNPLTEPAQAAPQTAGAHRYEEDTAVPYEEDTPVPPPDVADTQHIPVQREGEERWPEEPQPPDAGNGTGPLPRRTPRLFAITLVPLLLAAPAIVGLHGGTPARAEPVPYPSPCPTGIKAAGARAKPASGGTTASPHSSTRSPVRTPTTAASTPDATTGPAASPSPDPSPSDSTSDGGLIGGLLDGVGRLLGIGEESTPSAPATPPASAPPSTSPTPASSPTAGGDTGRTPTPAASPSSAKPTKSASATPKPTSSADCVVVDPKTHDADGVPAVQKVPDRMLGSKLTLNGFSFDGVTKLDTADGGTIRVLQFSMSSATTEDFELQVPGPGDRTISLTSSALTVQQAGDGGQLVKFYCSKFTGKLVLDILGVPFEIPIPLTFTPDFPPPLTFSKMVFADIDIQLVFVDTDVLKAPNLKATIRA